MSRSRSSNPAVHRDLKVDKDPQKGADVDQLRRSVSQRLKRRGGKGVAKKGPFGRGLVRAVGDALFKLGASRGKVDDAIKKGRVSEKSQRIIRDPGSRSPEALKRASDRKGRDTPGLVEKPAGRKAAIQYANKYIGIRENPAGSNKGGIISDWQSKLGGWLVGTAWCGTFCAACLCYAGVENIDYRMASVANIEDDARAARGPFRGWTTIPRGVQPGDLVVLFGRGVHVELVERLGDGVVYTVGGNTSSGNVGSQSNGGGVYKRTRPLSAVHGFALVRY